MTKNIAQPPLVPASAPASVPFLSLTRLGGGEYALSGLTATDLVELQFALREHALSLRAFASVRQPGVSLALRDREREIADRCDDLARQLRDCRNALLDELAEEVSLTKEA